jgi:protein ImuB
VHGLAMVAEHRPEYASGRREPALGTQHSTRLASSVDATPTPGPRPLWLLAAPKPLLERHAQPFDDGPLTLLAGPERIESGWWDDADIGRDYFIAARADRSLVWIYRERATTERMVGGWFLHGLFA